MADKKPALAVASDDAPRFVNIKAMDTSGLAVLELLGPDNEPLIDPSDNRPVTISLYGSDSEAYRKAWREYVDGGLARRMRRGAMKQQESAARTEEAVCKVFASVTADWKGLGEGSTPLKCDFDTAFRVYSQPGYRWIRDQVERFIGDRANFIPASSAS